tara:strand:+ start:735 stop:1235 length:501 start_codon:yes stop_codon:yes gene_type:complete
VLCAPAEAQCFCASDNIHDTDGERLHSEAAAQSRQIYDGVYSPPNEALAMSPASNYIELNVGGEKFVTSRSTLTSMPTSFFRALIDHTDTQPEYFIDRDPTHFRHILNFLRGSPTFPDSELHLFELCNEADFYNMPEVKDQAENYTSHIRKHAVAYQLSLICARIG